MQILDILFCNHLILFLSFEFFQRTLFDGFRVLPKRDSHSSTGTTDSLSCSCPCFTENLPHPQMGKTFTLLVLLLVQAYSLPSSQCACTTSGFDETVSAANVIFYGSLSQTGTTTYQTSPNKIVKGCPSNLLQTINVEAQCGMTFEPNKVRPTHRTHMK